MPHRPGWEPGYLGSATQTAAWARGWIEEEPREDDVWGEFTPEARDYWVGEVEAAMRRCSACGTSCWRGTYAPARAAACHSSGARAPGTTRRPASSARIAGASVTAEDASDRNSR